MTVHWSTDWQCWDCGKREPLEPGQDTRPVAAAHECASTDVRVRQSELAAYESGYRFALENFHDELVQADLHEFGTGWAGHLRRGPIVIDCDDREDPA